MSKPILCVDFDGVLHSYTSGWKGPDIVSDGPVAGAIKWLSEAVLHFEVHIYSSRTSQDGGRDAMRRAIMGWADDEIGFAAPLLVEQLHFPKQKPPAFLTIDDRAICFEGDWPEPGKLLDFKPWNKRSPTDTD